MNGPRSWRSGREKPTHDAHRAVAEHEHVHPTDHGTAGRAEPTGLGGCVGTDVRLAVQFQTRSLPERRRESFGRGR
jgi:hypothetical protein